MQIEVDDYRDLETNHLQKWVIKKWKIINPFSRYIETKHGKVYIPRGFLSDGATVVPDLTREAYLVHDLLYLRPTVEGKRLTKWQIDKIYGKLLWKGYRPFHAFIRPLGLAIFGWSSWKAHRKEEKADPCYWKKYILPKAMQWVIPSYHTKDTVFDKKP